jgi:7-carboxy-7-deazaguanine synthase (Cx14CxxC type)
VFLRFAGCNLWSGLERDRADAVCKFCDTEFVGTDGVGGGKFASADLLARAVAEKWPAAPGAKPYVVCTGGEPLLQIDDALVTALHDAGFEIGIETNGTLLPPEGIDWICVSPKADAELNLTRGNELKLIYPQEGAAPERYAGLAFDNFFLQPMDNAERDANTRAATEYCLAHPRWRLSLQTHKMLGIR